MTSPKPPLDMRNIFPEIDLISDGSLRERVTAVWQQLWKELDWRDIYAVPTSPEISYPHIPHNRAVLAMALAIADAFEKFHGVQVDRDVLIAAGLLQDVSKLVEMSPPQSNEAKEGKPRRFPHAFYAAHVALQHDVPDQICHIVLTHTPQSAQFPESLEGKILYYADQIDVIAIYKDRWKKDLYITK
jgi:hypothetical protein